MKQERSPSFSFYAKDWLDWKVLRMSDAAQGVYIRLLAFMWKDSPDQCSVPDDDKQIAKVIGKSPSRWKKLRKEIQLNGDPLFAVEDGRLVSHRLQRERIKQELRRKSLSDAGKKGAEGRWPSNSRANSEAKGAANGDAIDSPMAIDGVPRLGLSSSLSSSSSDREKKKSTAAPAQKRSRTSATSEGSSAKRLLDFFCESYETRLGLKYALNPQKDMQLLKGLVKVHGEDQIRAAIPEFLNAEDDFVKQSGRTIGIFKTRVQSILERRMSEKIERDRDRSRRAEKKPTPIDGLLTPKRPPKEPPTEWKKRWSAKRCVERDTPFCLWCRGQGCFTGKKKVEKSAGGFF